MDWLLWLIPALPFTGFLINGLVYLIAGRGTATMADLHHGHGDHASGHGDHGHDDHGHDDHGHGGHPTGGPTVGFSAPVVAAIGFTGPFLAFLVSLFVLSRVASGESMHSILDMWLMVGKDLQIPLGLSADPLTCVMLLVITGIGSAIHLYSYGYMHEDPAVARFFTYLNLFMTAMLILVLGDSLPMMFVGWEGVGLCSYLLIGFWHHDPANVDAGRKAFVANRVGDLAFLIGMFILVSYCGTLQFDKMQYFIERFGLVGDHAVSIAKNGPLAGVALGSIMTIAGGCLFVGATGKSAQIPLYVWLPDAMAGPTPVSALIHAATMVTAGVYMIGRMSFLFNGLEGVTLAIAFVGALTALFAGVIAMSQNDIKKVLAYSTMSQLGFMFAGMGTTEFASGMFHVVTHAFFKALLFLGAGAVIHALHGEQDIRKMGGLWKDLRGVAVLFIIGSIALAGLPPFAGFWSKDEILGNVLTHAMAEGGLWWAIAAMLFTTAGLTAFYTTRLVVITFFGKMHDEHRHPHAPHWTMMAALAFLAVLSVFGGVINGTPQHFLASFTHEVMKPSHAFEHIDHELAHSAHWIAMGLSIALALAGVAVGWFLYGMQPKLVDKLTEGPLEPLYRASLNKFYVDEAYDMLFVMPIREGGDILWGIADRIFIDQGMVEGPGRTLLAIGERLRLTQSGIINTATAAMVIGAVGMLFYMLVR